MIFDSSKLENFYLRGFSGRNSIVYSSIEKGWIIKDYKSLKETTEILGFFNETTIPIGLHDWSMFTTCEIMHKKQPNVQLKLTKVFS